MKTFTALMMLSALFLTGCLGDDDNKENEMTEALGQIGSDIKGVREDAAESEATLREFRSETNAKLTALDGKIDGIGRTVSENRDEYDQFSRDMALAMATLKAAPKTVVTPPPNDSPTGRLGSLSSSLGEATELMRGGIEAVKLLREFSDELDQLRGRGQDGDFNSRLEELEATQAKDAETRKRAAAQQSWISKHSQEMHELKAKLAVSEEKVRAAVKMADAASSSSQAAFDILELWGNGVGIRCRVPTPQQKRQLPPSASKIKGAKIDVRLDRENNTLWVSPSSCLYGRCYSRFRRL